MNLISRYFGNNSFVSNIYLELIWSFTKREVIGKYRGSVFGVLWSFLNPLFLLIIYTIVFSLIFKVKFGNSDSPSLYGLYLFSGLIPWMAFSETLTKSTVVIRGNANLVKKTVFPLEIFSVVDTLAGLIHSLFGMAIILCGIVIMKDQPLHSTIFLLPVIMIPQLLLTLGLGWFLSSVAVFFRDVSELVRIILRGFMFLTPIMYPLERVPMRLRYYIALNPMTSIVEGYRDVMLRGEWPNWDIGLVVIFGLSLSILGFIWFMKTKKAFADVI